MKLFIHLAIVAIQYVYTIEKKMYYFLGDTNLSINSIGGTYEKGYVEVLKKIAGMNIQIIYPGHGKPIIKNCNKIINISLKNILENKIL